MFVGIIVIAIAHGVILTPALLGECPFIYSGIGHQVDQTATDSPKEGIDGNQRGTELVAQTDLSGQVSA